MAGCPIHQGSVRARAQLRIIVSKELGLSLIELVFALALAMTLLGIAIPAYQHVILETRLSSLAERLLFTLEYARSEAIRRREPVTICASREGRICTGQWRDGWIVFGDRYTPRPSEDRLLQVDSALKRGEYLTWHGAGGHQYVQLDSHGSALGHNGSFIICVKMWSVSAVWRISLSQTGRVRLDKRAGSHVCEQ